MKKHLAATGLWLYVGWYAGTILSELAAISPLVGLIPAVLAAAWTTSTLARKRNAQPS